MTAIQQHSVKSILNKTKRRDPWFLDDYTINPYSGCSFNCTFCYIRGSKYGENMAEKLSAKSNAVELLDRQLANRAKKKQFGFIVLASATEPYLQAEKELLLTRQLLEVISRHRFPVHVITRSDLVTRDFDILDRIDKESILPDDLARATNRRVFITFSFSSLDPSIAKKFEPGATDPARRLSTLEQAVKAGFHSGVSLMPLLPGITDSQHALDNFYETFQKLGARYVLPAGLTLFGDGPADSKTLTIRAIEKYFPDLSNTYKEVFGYGFQSSQAYSSALKKRIQSAAAKYQLSGKIIS